MYIFHQIINQPTPYIICPFTAMLFALHNCECITVFFLEFHIRCLRNAINTEDRDHIMSFCNMCYRIECCMICPLHVAVLVLHHFISSHWCCAHDTSYLYLQLAAYKEFVQGSSAVVVDPFLADSRQAFNYTSFTFLFICAYHQLLLLRFSFFQKFS